MKFKKTVQVIVRYKLNDAGDMVEATQPEVCATQELAKVLIQGEIYGYMQSKDIVHHKKTARFDGEVYYYTSQKTGHKYKLTNTTVPLYNSI